MSRLTPEREATIRSGANPGHATLYVLELLAELDAVRRDLSDMAISGVRLAASNRLLRDELVRVVAELAKLETAERDSLLGEFKVKP